MAIRSGHVVVSRNTILRGQRVRNSNQHFHYVRTGLRKIACTMRHIYIARDLLQIYVSVELLVLGFCEATTLKSTALGFEFY